MRILCVYKSGGEYDIRYVIALKNAVKRFFPKTAKFVCLTDRMEECAAYEIDCIALKYTWEGWWSKFELFRPDIAMADHEVNVYFDLDVLIRRPIEDFLQVCQGAFQPLMLRSCDPVGEKNDWPSSSIISWKGKALNRLYYEFSRNPALNIKDAVKNIGRAGQRTDQGFMRQYIDPMKFQDYLEDWYIVFKYHYRLDNDLLQNCRILNWTGRPRFHQMEDKLDYWEIYSLWKTRWEGEKMLANEH